MYSALPPAQTPPPDADTSLLDHLAALLHVAGGHITYGHPVHGEADWDATTKTLILRADADPDTHTWALSEFCRLWHLGADYSDYIDTSRRHLQVVS